MNRAQAGLQTRTVTINVEFSITLECSELVGDNLYWIGLHDMNKNGRHRWAGHGQIVLLCFLDL